MSQPFVGQIQPVGFNFAPTGWALCQGQLLNISSNTALFSLLGTQFGGNGTTTFGLPDLRGRVAVGMGQGPGLAAYTIGEQAGLENTTLLVSQLPAHSHSVAIGAAQTSNQPVGALLAQGGAYASATGSGMAASNFIASTGSGQPISNLQPYLVINYIIALQGVFPSRN